jgi:translation initiation factor IF-3
MEVIGKIKVIGTTQEVNASFKKRELVVTTEEQYPQHILIEFAQDKCSVLDSYKLNENVKVSINLRGREWTNPEGVVKYFNQIQGWRIDKLEDSQVNKIEVIEPDEIFAPATAPKKKKVEETDDDLPF